MSTSLDTASAYFDEHRAEWIQAGHGGKWVAIHETTLVGFYSSFSRAFGEAAAKFPPGSFLVKQVKPTDRVETIQRVFLVADLGQPQSIAH